MLRERHWDTRIPIQRRKTNVFLVTRRVQCGAETSLSIIGIGSGAVVGIYANIIEFVAVIDSTPDCALETREWWDLNAGAYAHLDVVVDYTTIGPVPTVSTTLLSAPTMTQCWIATNALSTSATAIPVTTSKMSVSSTASASSISVHPSRSSQDLTPAYTSISTYSTTSNSYIVPAIVSLPTVSANYPLHNVSSSSHHTLNSSTLSMSVTASSDTFVTSTVYSENVYTLTSCAANVVNCPTSYQKEIIFTQTTDVFTTICTASARLTKPPLEPEHKTTPPQQPTTAYKSAVEIVLLTSLATPIKSTFMPPSSTAAVMLAAINTVDIASTTTSVSHAITSSGWKNSSSVTLPLVSTSLPQPSGTVKGVSAQHSMTAAAVRFDKRPITLAVAVLLATFAIHL